MKIEICYKNSVVSPSYSNLLDIIELGSLKKVFLEISQNS